jgi:predicted membrane metal-binding protein
MDVFVSLAILLGMIIAGFLMVGMLVSTPWQILLVLLVVGLVTIWWLMRQNSVQVVAETASEVESAIAPATTCQDQSSAFVDPALKYRGTSYSSTTELNPSQPQPVQTTGRYRGSFWQKAPFNNKSASVRQVPIAGKYRGCEWKSFTNKPD